MSDEIMQEFTGQFGFIIFFLVSSLLISLTFGEKVLYGYLLLVFLSQMVLNADKIGSIIRKI